jgi:MFS family permease
LNAVLVGSALQLVLIPFFGHLSDRVGRRPVYFAGALGAAVWVWAFFALIDTSTTTGIVLAAAGGLVCHAAMYGPQASFVTELFPTSVRYSGASIGYQAAGVLGGALAPIISVALLKHFDTSVAVSVYVVAALVLTLVAVAVAKETRTMNLAAPDPSQPDPVETASDVYPEERAHTSAASREARLGR